MGDEAPAAVAERLALEKARAIAHGRSDGIPVVGADTVVVYQGRVLNKPKDTQEARDMLCSLRGDEHMVVTGIALVSGGVERTGHAGTAVTMREYSDEEIEGYIASGDCMDKAGAYGIQHPAFSPAAGVDGCYMNVVGLPLCALARMLKEAGVDIKKRPDWSLPEQCLDCNVRDGLEIAP
jgi:MAF protein